jgi:hypothetical protein
MVKRAAFRIGEDLDLRSVSVPRITGWESEA